MINEIQFRNVWKRAFNKGFTPNIALKGFGVYVETSILFKIQHKYGVSCVETEKHLTLLPNLSSFSHYLQWMVSRGLWSPVRWSTCAGSSSSSEIKSTTCWIAWSPQQSPVWPLQHQTVASSHTHTHTHIPFGARQINHLMWAYCKYISIKVQSVGQCEKRNYSKEMLRWFKKHSETVIMTEFVH